MTIRGAIEEMYDELVELSFLLCNKINVDINKESGELCFYAGTSGITPDKFDNIMSCYFSFKYGMTEVNEV